jgi:hypothetical protein
MVVPPIIPALWRQGQEDQKLQVSLDYIIRTCLKKKKKKNRKGVGFIAQW